MIRIISYKSINGVDFGASQSEVITQLGKPIKIGKNNEDELEFDYSSFVLRFEALSSQLRECTLLPNCQASINGVEVIWSYDFLRWLCSQDSDLKDLGDFVLSLKLGVSVSGFHDGETSHQAIHAFKRGD